MIVQIINFMTKMSTRNHKSQATNSYSISMYKYLVFIPTKFHISIMQIKLFRNNYEFRWLTVRFVKERRFQS